MNTYKVTWFNMFHGKYFEEVVQAENSDEAEKIVDVNQKCKVELVEGDCIAKNHIVDAEEILFEMDANKCDSLTTKEGLNCKTQTFTREEIETSLDLQSNNEKMKTLYCNSESDVQISKQSKNWNNGDGMMMSTLKRAYLKMTERDESVGWEELTNELANTLAQVMGDEEFCAWVTRQREG